ncbi:hypothetical protein SPSYN_01738 [Sporotomaculum syntrophicum]|uniref:N-acetyltransferase domain-containing protein n=1 Tax=Sporotomaculum syntrophicum TaxID=182264 RepID=A0A9D2WR52_9FIRM|nr:GNAT family N-acetyltransferase [Sporotomaculum syntrophicum]KAF1085595.1 hypothetical protein SPSYN_01738 [Sporotomaculum syntrophicum]
MKVRVTRVNNNLLMRSFLAVPALVYGAEAVPPSANKYATSMRFVPLVNPLLQHLNYANFVAFADGQPVGRITASIDQLNPRPEEGFWGCFECLDNDEAAAALFDAAADWLKEQGKTVMIGPATLNTNQQVGLMIKGFEYEPQIEIPYNPPYYQQLVENAGHEKIHDLECFKWMLPDELPEVLTQAEGQTGVVMRKINYTDAREARIVQEINNKAMSGIWGFIPMSLADTQGFLMSLVGQVPPDLFMIIEVNGQPAGMFLSIPYKNPGRKDSGGIIRLAIGGVVPEFRHMGLHWKVLRSFYAWCKKHGYTEGEASQVAESNDTVKRKIIMPLFGGQLIKLFRVYQRKLV